VIDVVAAVWLREGRVLATRRGPQMHLAGLWEFPGGKIEPGEDEGAALEREILEELSVRVRAIRRLGEADHDYGKVHVRLIAWEVHGDGEPVIAEHDAMRWLTPDELESVEWAPADVPLLGAVRQALAHA